MSDCENLSRIGAFHDGELPADEAEEFAAHVRQCAQCRQELARLRALSAWLSAAPSPAAAPGALDRLRRSAGPRQRRAALRTAQVLTAAAAVLLVCAVLLWQGRQASPAPAGLPDQWEAAAVAPAPAMALGLDNGQDADVQLAQLILGGSASGGIEDNE